MGTVMREAAFSLAEANFTGAEFGPIIQHNVAKAQIKVMSKKENVAGVKLPTFDHYEVKIFFIFIFKRWAVQVAIITPQMEMQVC